MPGAGELLIACGFQPDASGDILQLEAPTSHTLSLLHGAFMLLSPDQSHFAAPATAQSNHSASVSPEPLLDQQPTGAPQAPDRVATAADQLPHAPAAEPSRAPAASTIDVSARNSSVRNVPVAASERKEQLGLSPGQWMKQAGCVNAVSVGGSAVAVPRQDAAKAAAATSAPPAEAAAAAAAAPEPFTGRNTKVLCH